MVQVTTTGTPAAKPFAWSYSKLKNFEVCPKRHFHIDIAKDVKEDESEELAYGNQLHNAIAARIEKGTALPKPFSHMEAWCHYIATTPGVNLVERKYAIREDFSPCRKANGAEDFFSKQAWYRGIADVVKLFPDESAPVVALAIDWKTGKIKEDGVQLALMAQCLFSHYPTLQKIRTDFVWLKESTDPHNAVVTRADFTRADMVGVWNGLSSRVKSLKHAYDTQSFPANPNPLCRKWCPVRKCPHHGE